METCSLESARSMLSLHWSKSVQFGSRTQSLVQPIKTHVVESVAQAGCLGWGPGSASHPLCDVGQGPGPFCALISSSLRERGK